MAVSDLLAKRKICFNTENTHTHTHTHRIPTVVLSYTVMLIGSEKTEVHLTDLHCWLSCTNFIQFGKYSQPSESAGLPPTDDQKYLKKENSKT